MATSTQSDPTIRCECHPDPDKRCKGTLVGHIERKGRYVKMIVDGVPGWDTRPEPIGKKDVENACDYFSSKGQQELGRLFEHIRRIARQQRAVPGEVAAAASAAEPAGA